MIDPVQKEKMVKHSYVLLWAFERYMKYLEKPNAYTMNQWYSMDEDTRKKIEEEDKIKREWFSRNKQIIVGDDVVYTCLEKKKAEYDEEGNRKKTDIWVSSLPAYSVQKNYETERLEFPEPPVQYKDYKIKEQGYKRINDNTFAVGFKEKEFLPETRQYVSNVTWHNGQDFKSWYFSSTEDRYPLDPNFVFDEVEVVD